MEDGIRDSSEDGGACVPLIPGGIEAEGVSYDDARLNQLGYKQELSRSLSYVLLLFSPSSISSILIREIIPPFPKCTIRFLNLNFWMSIAPFEMDRSVFQILTSVQFKQNDLSLLMLSETINH